MPSPTDDSYKPLSMAELLDIANWPGAFPEEMVSMAQMLLKAYEATEHELPPPHEMGPTERAMNAAKYNIRREVFGDE